MKTLALSLVHTGTHWYTSTVVSPDFYLGMELIECRVQTFEFVYSNLSGNAWLFPKVTAPTYSLTSRV